ncbi:MAG: hypothetical protein ACI4DY_11030 [Monoglobaceae bacterium]
MKMGKKLLSLALSAAMCAGIALPVNASVFSENKIFVSHFDDFSSWTSTQGAIDDLPEGFFAVDGNTFPGRATATGTYVDDAVGTRAYKLGANAMVGYQFDQVYKTGTRRISFDLKLSTALTNENTDDGKNRLYFNGHENNGNDNPYDYWHADAKNGTNWDVRPYGYIKLGDFTAINEGWSGKGNTTGEVFNDLKWHKVEILFDYDNNKISYFVDGSTIAQDNEGNKNKSFYFTNETGTDVYIDNFAVFHGANPEYAEAVRMSADAYGGLVGVNNGKLNIDLSRALSSDAVVQATDFTVKDSAGSVVSNAVTAAQAAADRSKSTISLTTGALAAGVYTLEYANAANSVSFIVGESTVVSNYDTERYYYMNEDFESYIGGVPAQWQATTSSVGVPSVGNDGVNGKTLKMSSGSSSSYMNKFDSFQSGKLKVEFDMKTAGKGWGIGFIREADSAAEDYEKHLAIGNTAGEAADIYTCVTTDAGLNTKQTATIKNDDWNHVSITVNMTTEKYEFDVNGTTFETRHPYNVSSYQKVAWYDVIKTGTEDAQESYKCGLNGIRLYSDGTSDVEFDNIKIYADNSTYLSEDFTGYSPWYNNLPAGYFRRNDINNGNNLLAAAAGVNDSGADDADNTGAKINTGSWEHVRIRFAHPITDLGNKTIALEFDAKPGAELYMVFYPKEKFYGNGSSDKGSMINNPTDGIYRDNMIQLRTNSSTFGFSYNTSYTYGGMTQFVTASGDDMTPESGKWNHFKIEFDPVNGVTAYLTKSDGTVLQSTTVPKENVYLYKKLLNEYNNIFGMAVFGGEGYSSTSIDNLKVYEVSTVNKPTVASVKAINIDDTATALSDGVTEISNLTKAIEMKFTEPINETTESMANKVTLTKTDGSALSTTGVLSTDKKTYTLNINETPAADSYATLKTSLNINGASSVAQLTNPVSKALKFVGGAGEATVSDMQLYKKILGRELTSGTTVRTSPDVWVPATTRNDADAEEYKIVISGSNTTGVADNTKFDYITGIYDTSSGTDVLANATVEKLNIPAEVEFTKEISIPSVSDTQEWRTFIWTNGQTPVVDVLK